jgi:hypothetical protein
MLLTELRVDPQIYNERIDLGQGLYETKTKLLDNHINLTLVGCDGECYEYLKSLVGAKLAIVEVPYDL